MNTRKAAVVALFAASSVSLLVAQAVIFKTISLGNYSSSKALTDAMTGRGMSASGRAQGVMKTLTVSQVRTQIDLVVMSVGELGLPDFSKYPDIVASAKKRGLDLCPGEVGPQLRLQYTNQSEDETLRVAMEPVMSGFTPVPTVFVLSGKSLLSADTSNPFDRNNLWVFVRR
jgi:hypothetical protein